MSESWDRSLLRFELRFESKDLPNHQKIKKAKKSLPKDQVPDGTGELGNGRGNHTIPIDKL